jgi:predicted NBD/HSP70 family sugar kinase
VADNQNVLRHINRMGLVQLVRSHPGLSRLDLAAQSGVPRATVGLLVQELLREGWLRERPTSARSGAGRRPVPLELDRSRLALVGAELGADYLNVVACDLGGEILHAEMVPFHHGAVERSLQRTCALVATARAFLRRHRRRPLGLGLGVQGMMDTQAGVLRFSPNLGWHDVPVTRMLREGLVRVGCNAFDRPLVLNGSGAAALSEYVFGTDLTGPLVFLDMGVGLGSGIVVRGRLLLGHDGLAGEVGHTILSPNGPLCTCGRRGCAETLISQRAVSRGVTGRETPVLPIPELVERLSRGDGAATAAAAQAGTYLGMLIQNLANTLNPETVVLGGKLCALGDPLVQTALRVMRENAGLYDHHRHTVRLGRFGLDAAALGAAAGVLQGLLNAADALDPVA